MRRSHILALATVTMLASFRTAEAQNPPQPASGHPNSQVSAAVIPTGTVLDLALNHVVGPNVNHVGDRFYATVLQPLRSAKGELIVPQGATVSGTITALSSPDRTPTLVRLNFDQISWRGRTRRFTADVQSVSFQPDLGRNAADMKAAAAPVSAEHGTVISGAELDKLIADGALTAGHGTVLSLGAETFIPVGSKLVVRTNQELVLK